MSIVPLPGVISTWTPASPAIWPAHAPDALTTNWIQTFAMLPSSSSRSVERRLDQLPRLDRAVGDPERAPDPPVERRLLREQRADLDLLAVDAARRAVGRECLDVVVGVVRRRDEVAARGLDRGRRDPAQHPVLGDALARRHLVLLDIATAGVEEAVVAARGAGAV